MKLDKKLVTKRLALQKHLESNLTNVHFLIEIQNLLFCSIIIFKEDLI